MRAHCAATLLVICTSGTLIGCAREPQSRDAQPLVELGPRAITPADLVVAQRPGLDESRAERLERLIGTALLAKEARARRIADEPEVRAQLSLLRARAALEEDALLAQVFFERERAGVSPHEEDLLAHYEKTKGRYRVRMMTLRRQVFGSRDEAEAANARLGRAGRLDPSKAETVGPSEIQRLPRAVLPEVLGLHAPGERVVAGNALEGFSLVELVEYLPASPLSFAEVREKVAVEVATTGALAALESRARDLRREASVEIDEAALADDEVFESLEHAADALRPRFDSARRFVWRSAPSQ